MSKLLFLSLRQGELAPEIARAEYHDVLNAAGLSEVDVELKILDRVDEEVGSLEAISGIIIGGSSLNVSNAEYSPWQRHINDVLAGVVESGLPVFFVCFGISWLVDHLGGTVGHTHPENSGPTSVALTEAGRGDRLLRGATEQFTALTGHTENPDVDSLPEALTVLATGPTCPVQMVRYGDHVWATQFHAEMDAAAMHTRMDFFYNYGYFPAEDYARIVADLPNHDVAWANAILRNFAQYCFDRSPAHAPKA